MYYCKSSHLEREKRERGREGGREGGKEGERESRLASSSED